MRDHFIPPSYKNDLYKKMHRLEQGNISIQDYDVEFQKCAICCEMVEDMNNKIIHFYGGLRHKI